jgi:4-hydroxy-tetrahydrodipicolinate reductase
MRIIKIMVNGLPGNMAAKVAEHAERDERFQLIAFSLTGPEITDDVHKMPSGMNIRLIRPNDREQMIGSILSDKSPFICVDYSHPYAVNTNAEFYCRHQIPFVMGTTGGDRKELEDTVRKSLVPAVIAPNMAKQIVGFQAMLQNAADMFPNLFAGYTLHVKESHQHGKADTSGTAKAVISYFNRLGIPFGEKDIKKERDPEIQQKDWRIPEPYIGGHGWHTYTLLSADETVKFEFTHNVNGRDVYAQGTLDAVSFLDDQISTGQQGMFSMIDVLKGSMQ